MVLLKKKQSSNELGTSSGYRTPPSRQNSSQQLPYRSSSDQKLPAGNEAQRLATQSSWADTYVPSHTPTSVLTPTTSTTAENVTPFPSNIDPSDPPPMYTPTDHTSSANSYSVRSEIGGPADSVGPSNSRAFFPPFSPIPPEVVPLIPNEEEQNTSPWSRRVKKGTLISRLVRWGQEHHRARQQQQRKHRQRKIAVFLWLLAALLICLFMLTRGSSSSDHASSDIPPSAAKVTPAWSLPQREYQQEETSHAITGKFSVYDLLDLKTTSGTISITLKPCPGTKPAHIRLSTTSGSIKLQLDSSFFKTPEGGNRTFHTTITTKSGSISGTIMHGNGGSTRVESNSGSIRLEVKPITIGDGVEASTLFTASHSGSQYIRVLGSKKNQHDLALNTIQATHLENGSGSMRITYPPEWRGQAHLRVDGSGHVAAKGDGLEKQQNGRKELYVWRGEQTDSKVEIYGKGSGSAALFA